ncbi:helix-turn-helix transcriptional regulator [Malikia spinosa]|nr:AlpA family phage regulatory protein [Malikia spinosa]
MRTEPATTTQAPTIHLAHSAKPVTPRDRLLRLPEVESITGMKKTSIYALMREGKFPQRICISRRMSAWSEVAVLQWVQTKISGNAEAAK